MAGNAVEILVALRPRISSRVVRARRPTVRRGELPTNTLSPPCLNTSGVVASLLFTVGVTTSVLTTRLDSASGGGTVQPELNISSRPVPGYGPAGSAAVGETAC